MQRENKDIIRLPNWKIDISLGFPNRKYMYRLASQRENRCIIFINDNVLGIGIQYYSYITEIYKNLTI